MPCEQFRLAWHPHERLRTHPLNIILNIFLSSLAPVFLVAGVGWLLAHYFHPDVRSLSQISLYALIPCLIFQTLVTTPVDWGKSGRIGLFCLAVILVSALAGWIVGRVFHLDRQMTIALMLVLMFTNVGNFGLPVVAYAFGQQALVHATVYFVVMNVALYTIGIGMVSARGVRIGPILMNLIKLPAVSGVFVAVAVVLLRIQVPGPLMSAIDLIGKATLGINLLILGMQLHQYKLRPTHLVWLAVALRLVVVPLSLLPVARWLELSKPALQAGMLQAATPAGVTTTILAAEYECLPEFVSNVVVLSTLLSVITITPLILLV